MPDVSRSEASFEASVLERMVVVKAPVVPGIVVAHPFIIAVNVRTIRIPMGIGKPVVSFVAAAFFARHRHRAVLRNVTTSDRRTHPAVFLSSAGKQMQIKRRPARQG